MADSLNGSLAVWLTVELFKRSRIRTMKSAAFYVPTVACVFVVLAGGLGTETRGGPRPAIQAALQHAMQQAMPRSSGTIVAVDVASGTLIASTNLEVAAKRLARPGSAIKPFTLLALLRAQKIRAGTYLVCRRKLNIDGHQMDCTHPATVEALDAASALAYSCNYYFAHFATLLTPTELRQEFLHAGFGETTGLAESEDAGSVKTASSTAALQLQALGDADVEVTPLELLMAYRKIASMKNSGDQNEMVRPLFSGLEGSTEFGMGRLAQPKSLKVAGKTGTSSADEGTWTHGWFAGYAPAERPEIAIVVFLEKGRGADAATLARHVFSAYESVLGVH